METKKVPSNDTHWRYQNIASGETATSLFYQNTKGYFIRTRFWQGLMEHA